LRDKKVVCTIHHLVPEKFDYHKLNEFVYRDQFVDLYHVPSTKTKNQIERLTKKPIFVNPFWVNQNLWRNLEDKDSLRTDFGISNDCYLIGSFQRDTEGSDLKSPKLEKGPDQFCDAVEQISKTKNVEVLLAGWRRQYVINRLEKANVKYHYFKLPSFDDLNKLYNCLDLYVVASRHEGGPQAIFECATTKTPILSTDVGAASLILDSKSIFKPGNILKAEPNLDMAYDNVKELHIPIGFNAFVEAFRGLNEDLYQ
jgi:glycosyltransferase involved in cell wall biosynthesis